MPMEPLKVLFVCVENACRSQMAEGFARHYGKSRVEAFSAGSRPRGQVDQDAIAVMQEKGIDLRQHASKALSDLPDVVWDAVVTMGCGDACPAVPARKRLDWQIPDPAHHPLEVYRQVRNVIDSAVKLLVEQLTGADLP
jgi:protein-tyrosine-phosphatase